jgi:S-formylglutathione hydrolase FrmB
VFAAFDVPATRSHFAHRPGEVYLPPAYFTSNRRNLPVLIMLAGTPGTPAHWIKAGGAEATVEAYAAANRGRAPVLVFVDQNGGAIRDTECVDGPQGNAETYLTVDVPAYVTRTLHVTRDPGKWGIVGFSEGGTCALDLTLGHPDRFRNAVDLAGDARPNLGNPEHSLERLFGGSTADQRRHDPRYLMTVHRYPGVTVWLAAGGNDGRRLQVVRSLGGAATRSGITTHEVTVAGGHNWQFARATFARILPQLGDELGLSNSS